MVVHVPVHREVLVEAPAHRQVIEDDVANGIAAERVVALRDAGGAAAEAQVTDHHIVCFELDGVSSDADAVTGRGGAVDGDVGRANANLLLEADDAGDIEDDNSRPRGFERFAKRAWAHVVEAGYDVYLAVATA